MAAVYRRPWLLVSGCLRFLAIPHKQPATDNQELQDEIARPRYLICITTHTISASAMTITTMIVMALLRVELELTVS